MDENLDRKKAIRHHRIPNVGFFLLNRKVKINHRNRLNSNEFCLLYSPSLNQILIMNCDVRTFWTWHQSVARIINRICKESIRKLIKPRLHFHFLSPVGIAFTRTNFWFFIYESLVVGRRELKSRFIIEAFHSFKLCGGERRMKHRSRPKSATFFSSKGLTVGLQTVLLVYFLFPVYLSLSPPPLPSPFISRSLCRCIHARICAASFDLFIYY